MRLDYLSYRTVYSSNTLNSTSVFHNNTGIDGGGLAMYGESYLVFEENSLLNFTNNRQSKEEEPFLLKIRSCKNSPCFYQYSEGTCLQNQRKVISLVTMQGLAGTVLFGGNRYCFFLILS